MAAAVAGFTLLALAVWSVPGLSDVWPAIAIVAFSLSLAMLIAFWDVRLSFGIAIDVGSSRSHFSVLSGPNGLPADVAGRHEARHPDIWRWSVHACQCKADHGSNRFNQHDVADSRGAGLRGVHPDPRGRGRRAGKHAALAHHRLSDVLLVGGGVRRARHHRCWCDAVGPKDHLTGTKSLTTPRSGTTRLGPGCRGTKPPDACALRARLD